MSDVKALTLPCNLSPEDTITLTHMPNIDELNIEIMTDGNRVLTSVTLDPDGLKHLYAFLDEAILGSLVDYTELTGG